MPSRLAGMSLLEVAEASSPGPGKVEPRSRLSPFRKAAAFAGGAISEGEEEEEDDDEVRVLCVRGLLGRGGGVEGFCVVVWRVHIRECRGWFR